MVDFDFGKLKLKDIRNIAVYCVLFLISLLVFIIIVISFTRTEIDEISLAHNWVTNSLYYH